MLAAEQFSSLAEIQRRAGTRVPFTDPCFVQTDEHSLWVDAINLSENGMCLTVDRIGVLKRGIRVAIFIRSFSAIDAVVQWTRGSFAGIKFSSGAKENSNFLDLFKRLKAGEPSLPPQSHPDVDSIVGDSIRELLNPQTAITVDALDQLETQPVEQLRAHERFHFDQTCWIQTEKRKFQAEGINLSEGGMCLRLNGLGSIPNGTDVKIIFEDHSPVDATLRWSKERIMGFQFLTPIKDHPILQNLESIDD